MRDQGLWGEAPPAFMRGGGAPSSDAPDGARIQRKPSVIDEAHGGKRKQTSFTPSASQPILQAPRDDVPLSEVAPPTRDTTTPGDAAAPFCIEFCSGTEGLAAQTGDEGIIWSRQTGQTDLQSSRCQSRRRNRRT